MAASTLESEAAFKERASQIGIEGRFIEKFVEKEFATFGRYAFSVVFSPHHTDEAPLRNFLTDLLDEAPSGSQLACMRRLFFESHTMALTDARQRVEASPGPALATRKLATAERVARQKSQEERLGGLVFTPETTPANHVVDLFVEMGETGILTYIKPELCCSRAQEVSAVKKDTTVSTDASGMLKLGTKAVEAQCEANTELKLRSAWQRRNLAMDLAGLASFEVTETWVQTLFSHLIREAPRGFAKVSLQQILDCDRQLFILASHRTMGKLKVALDDKDKPLLVCSRNSGIPVKSCNISFLCPHPVLMNLLHHRTLVLRNFRRPTRCLRRQATKVVARLAATRKFRSQMVVPLTTMTIVPCALRSRTTSASSRDPLANVVQGGITSATRKVATDRSPTRRATIQTDSQPRRRFQFLFLLNFLQEEDLFPELLCKQAYEW